MRIAFYGAAHEVTGSCTVLYIGDKTVMVDCGMEQGADVYENCELPMLPAEVDAVLLTHAHIDHSGKLPALVAGGYRGPIYTTAATERLVGIMLRDSAHIQETEAKWRNRKAERTGEELYVPLYTLADVERTLAQIVPCEYDTDYTLLEGVRVRFTDAGHLLGSASVSVSVTEGDREETVVFSGDLGNHTRPLIRDPKTPPHADYVVIESTYGDREHRERPDYIGQLTRILQDTLDRGGNLIIPAFAVGRTQELLYLLRTIKEEGLIKGHGDFPVYVDSPLAVEATEIYGSNLTSFFDEESLALIERGINPIKLPGLRLSVESEESIAINTDKTPKVIISSSGMCEAGRIRHHLKHNLWRADSTVLFVGYQSEGTLGRILLDGARYVRLFGEEVRVSARIENLAGISGHADRGMLLRWLEGFPVTPKTVFVNHGEDAVCDVFAKTVEERLLTKTVAPYNASVYDLTTGIFVDEGNKTRIVKGTRVTAKAEKKQEASAFRHLERAYKRLLGVIERYRRRSNKDISKFAGQINSLCDKWERKK